MNDKLEKLFLQPWLGGITAVLTILAGTLTAFYPDDIKFSHALWPYISATNISFIATSFWLSVFLVGLLFWGSQWAQSRAGERARDKVDKQASDLERLILRLESLPPENFLADYQTILQSATNSAAVGMSSNSIVEIETAIRNILGAVLELARSYDKRVDTFIYAANIMIFKSRGQTEAANPITLNGIGPDDPHYCGCLELIPTLSTTTEEQHFGPDKAITSFVMYVPKDTKAVVGSNLKPRFPVLPGATWAFVYKEFVGFPSIETLGQWLEENSSVDQGLQKAVREYFSNGHGAHIRSLVSMPLLSLGIAANEDEDPIGVLNLHSTRGGLLLNKGAERFGPLLEPFRMLLSILLAQRGIVYKSSVSLEDKNHGK